MKANVVITHRVHPEVTRLLSENNCDVLGNPQRERMSRSEVLRIAEGADALMAFMPDIIDDEFLRACRRLRIVAAALKGYDNFDVRAMTDRGIWFTMVPDLLTEPTAELAVALLLGLVRRVPEGDRLVRSGQFGGWRPQLYGTSLSGGTLGIVGMGSIGRAIARNMSGFDLKIIYHDRRRLDQAEEMLRGLSCPPLDRLLGESDFIILCVPLAHDTFHLINAKTLATMKPGSFLVNVCRGSVVDENAVGQALESGHLSGYAADVFEMEDWQRTDRPHGIAPALLAGTRTLFTPHLGSAVGEVRRRIELRAAMNILQALRGQTPRDAVNRPMCMREHSPYV